MDEHWMKQGFAEIWTLFKETDRKFQETDRLIQELRAQSKETDRKFQETDRKFQETDRKFQETDRKFQETDRQLKESDRKMQAAFQEMRAKSKELEDIFFSKWGRFMEVLVESGALTALQQYGLDVYRVSRDIKEKRKNGEGRGMQIDVLCWGDRLVVPIEVKTTLKVEYVREHEDRLARWAECFPEFADAMVYGAVAALSFDEESDRYAYRRGLYVLTLVGEEMVRVINDHQFRPKNWQMSTA